MSRAFFAFLLFMICSATPVLGQSGKKIALVIGNSTYQYAPELENPKNDATDMAIVFERLDFAVIKGVDLTKAGMDNAIRDFAGQLSGADVGVFYYAGHGLQYEGQNYLVPVDAKAESAAALDFEMVKLALVQRTMEREVKASVLFLDACRNNPLTRSLARALGHRSIGLNRGLAEVKAATGTLISFATSPGNVAQDGTGRNSPYTAALKKHILTPGRNLSATLIKVRVDVAKATNNTQIPWEQSALMGQLYFGGSADNAPKETTMSAPRSEAASAWDVVKDTKDPAALEAFASRYDGTVYADMARAVAKSKNEKKSAMLKRDAPKKRATSHRASPRHSAAVCTNRSGLDYCVSSYLPSSGVNRSDYGPRSISDGNDRTAWVEGRTVQRDLGVGEWVLLDWGQERQVAGVTLKNGYAKTSRLYRKNARVSRLKLTMSGGQSFSISVDDTSSRQTLRFNESIAATWMKVEIESAIMGSKYADTAINELRAIFE